MCVAICGVELMETSSGSPAKDQLSSSRSFLRRKTNVFVVLPTILSMYFLGAGIAFLVCARTFISFHIFSLASPAPVQLFHVNNTYLPWQESLTVVSGKGALEVLEELQAPAHTLRDERGAGIVRAEVNASLLMNSTGSQNLDLVGVEVTTFGEDSEARLSEIDVDETLQDLDEPEFMQMPTLKKHSEKAANLQSRLKEMSTWDRRRWLTNNWDNFQIVKEDSLSDQFQDRMRRFFCYPSEESDVQDSQMRRLLSVSAPQSENTSSETLEKTAMDKIDEQKVCKTNGNGEKGSFCSHRFFLTWMSPVSSFSPRERIGLESIFKWHPQACVVILSRTMDSDKGRKILKPFVKKGYRIKAVTPDLVNLFAGLPAAAWLRHLRDGTGDPGCINFMQNLSNIMRLAVLYKYGGVYLDTDIIVLKAFDGLRNVVGAQSASDSTGHWTRLNNAVLVFDREHPILYELLREFVATFDGNRWGWNGPYLVSRVVQKVTEQEWQNCSSVSVLPLVGFYPVNWIDIVKFFHSPISEHQNQWQAKELEWMQRGSYAIHLWNKKSNHLRVEKGSIMEILFKKSCLFCKVTAGS